MEFRKTCRRLRHIAIFFVGLIIISFLIVKSFLQRKYESEHEIIRNSRSKLNRFEEFHSIPRFIHFVWVKPMLKNDGNELPLDVQHNIEEWKENNSFFKVIVWKGKDILEQFPELSKLLQKIPVSAWIANILRYKISYEYGGLYLDTDIRALKSVDRLLQIFNFGFVVCENPAFSSQLIETRCKIASNAVIASRKHDATMKNLFEESVRITRRLLIKYGPINPHNFSYSNTGRSTGPALLTKHILRTNSLLVLGSYTFFPCSYTNKRNCIYDKFINKTDVYGMHQWKKRWS